MLYYLITKASYPAQAKHQDVIPVLLMPKINKLSYFKNLSMESSVVVLLFGSPGDWIGWF